MPSPTSPAPASTRAPSGRLLEEAGVATIAGTSFGAFGEGYLRFSYANSREKIGEAMQRIGELAGRRNAAGGAIGPSVPKK